MIQPPRPPSSASSRLSVSSWRSRRARLAPSATLAAISRRRAQARPRRRLATLVHAASKTSVVTPSDTQNNISAILRRRGSSCPARSR